MAHSLPRVPRHRQPHRVLPRTGLALTAVFALAGLLALAAPATAVAHAANAPANAPADASGTRSAAPALGPDLSIDDLAYVFLAFVVMIGAYVVWLGRRLSANARTLERVRAEVDALTAASDAAAGDTGAERDVPA